MSFCEGALALLKGTQRDTIRQTIKDHVKHADSGCLPWPLRICCDGGCRSVTRILNRFSERAGVSFKTIIYYILDFTV